MYTYVRAPDPFTAHTVDAQIDTYGPFAHWCLYSKQIHECGCSLWFLFPRKAPLPSSLLQSYQLTQFALSLMHWAFLSHTFSLFKTHQVYTAQKRWCSEMLWPICQFISLAIPQLAISLANTDLPACISGVNRKHVLRIQFPLVKWNVFYVLWRASGK